MLGNRFWNDTFGVICNSRYIDIHEVEGHIMFRNDTGARKELVSPYNFLPFYLPRTYSDIRRIIYLDSDIVVKVKRISPLSSKHKESMLIDFTRQWKTNELESSTSEYQSMPSFVMAKNVLIYVPRHCLTWYKSILCLFQPKSSNYDLSVYDQFYSGFLMVRKCWFT